MSEPFAVCLPGRRCGVSRQAFYGREERSQQSFSHSMLILDLLSALRREIPGLGTRKLHLLLNEPLAISGIKLGRDKLHKLLQNHGLVLRHRRQVPQTTNSNHRLKMYPNLLIDKAILQPRQIWPGRRAVCDITYICIGLGFGYLSLVTDAYSKLIVGYCLHPYLTAEGSLKALEMALLTDWEKGNGLIHHSDRGSQYCSFEYVRRLKRAGISNSMTQSGDPYENAIAERINGILKTDFRLNRVFTTFEEAVKAVDKSIYNYNLLRPHMSCDYLTSAVAHQSDQPLKKHWKPKVYK